MELFKSLVDRIKSIPGRKFEGSSLWTIPRSEGGQLDKLFTKKELVWEEDTSADIEFIPRTISTDVTFLDELLLQPYPFQIVGINFLSDVEKGMLADEMGLGKTSQILASVYRLYRIGKVKKALIICPATLKYQWEEEIEKFIDIKKYGIDYVIVDGDTKQRKAIYESLKEGNVLYTVINYELVRNDADLLSDIGFDVVALDEGHRIRNWKSMTSKAIYKLNSPFKWAATGTPMQNKPEELFNIFGWVNPEILGDWWKFRGRYMIIGEKFKQPNMVLGYKNLGELHRRIAPYMLRRLKKDVAPELPKILVNNFFVDMTPDQRSVHDEIRNELIDLIKEISKFTERDEDGNIIKQHPKANNILGMFIMLQEICDTPQLLVMSDSKMAARHTMDGKIDPRSPKIDELMTILTDFMSSGEGQGPRKAVIFTQFKRMQGLIVNAIKKLGGVNIVNGGMNAQEKQQSIIEFRTNDAIKFLVCTDSANYGVNLPEASLLVNVDLPWNPAVWDQRNARIHRLDSVHESVNIVNLISLGGLDEKILDTLYAKKDTASEIVENSADETAYLSTLTHDLMRKLLSKKTHKNHKK